MRNNTESEGNRSSKTLRINFAALIFSILALGNIWAAVTLDQVISKLQAGGTPLIQSYQLQEAGKSLDLKLDVKAWEAIPVDRRMRICEELADLDCWHEEVCVRLFIDNDVIGTMAPVSGVWHFDPVQGAAAWATTPAPAGNIVPLTAMVPSSTKETTSSVSQITQGAAKFYADLKRKYPDLPQIDEHSEPPHTIDILAAGAPGSACLELSMPRKTWDLLDQTEKDKLIVFLRSKIAEARQSPESWSFYPPESPGYLGEIQDLRNMKDDSWEISVGHLDSENYLVEDETILKGTDYSPKATKSVTYTAADPRVDPVYNSLLDSSVQQVKDYLGKTLDDADSVQYVAWTDVLKTGIGYSVSLSYRTKDSFGAYELKNQTFQLDQNGAVIHVKDNGR